MRLHSSRGVYAPVLLVVALVTAVTWYLLVDRGEVRLLAAAAMVAGLAVAGFGRPRAMLVLTLASLPLLGLVRRVFDVLARAPVDPLLAIAPALTVGLTLLAFYSNRGTVGRSLSESGLTRAVTALAAVFLLEVFNPMQGGIVVGLSGALFLLIPLLWYFLGRVHFDEATIERVLRWTLILGLVCGSYGIWQAVVGFNVIDQKWIDDREGVFQSLWLGRFVRPMSTFPSPEEWSRYMAIAATVAFGVMSLRQRGRLLAMATFGVAVMSLLMCAVRISVFGLLVSLGVLLAGSVRSRPAALVRVGLLGVALVAFLALVPALTMDEMSASDRALDAFFGHASRGLRTPLEEESFQARLVLWQKLMVDFVPSHPLGTGLGGSTLGGARLGGAVYVLTESYAITVFVAAGIVGGCLFLLITALATARCMRIRASDGSPFNLIAAAVVVGVLFTSLTGNSLSLYSVGPLGWALIGYLSTLVRPAPSETSALAPPRRVALVAR